MDPRQSGSGPVSDLRSAWQERRPRLSLPSPPGDRSARFRPPADLGQAESSAAASGDRTDPSPVPGSPTLVRAAPVHSGCRRCPHLQEHGVPAPGSKTIDCVGHMNHAGGVDVGDQQIAGSISGRLQMVLCPVESSGRGWVLQRIEAEMSTGAWILGW